MKNLFVFFKHIVVVLFMVLTISSCESDDKSGSLGDSEYSESNIYTKLAGEWSCYYDFSVNDGTFNIIFYSNGTYYRDLWVDGVRNYWRVGDYEYSDGCLFFYDSDETTVSVIYEVIEFTDSTLILSVNNGSSIYEYYKVEE